MYKIIFKIKHNNNLLYYNNCFYKYRILNDNITYINIHNIIKKLFLNYFIMPKYQILFIDQVLENTIRKKYINAIFLPNQV